MTVDELRSARKSQYATEMHLSPEEYVATRKEVSKYLGGPPPKDPQRYTEHFVFEGLKVIRSFE